MFPAMLMAHSENYVVPDNVPANEFLNLEGRKLSTSRGFAVWLPDYLAKFKPDPLRYALARNLPETRDMNFTWEGFQARNNNELGNNFGNLINRVLTFIHKYFEGRVPAWDPEDHQMMDRAPSPRSRSCLTRWQEHLERFEIKAAMECALRRRPGGQPLLRRVGALQHPQDRPRPLRPQPRRGAADHAPDLRHARAGRAVRDGEGVGLAGHVDAAVRGRIRRGLEDLPAGRQLGVPEILFPRLEPETIQGEIDRLKALVEEQEVE